MQIPTDSFLPAPSVKTFGASVPELNCSAQIPHDDGFSGQIKQLCTSSKRDFTIAQLLGPLFNSPLKIKIQPLEHPSLAVQFGKYADLGTQHFRHNRHRNIIHGAAAISLNLI